MKVARFVVYGNPKGKGRPRFTTVCGYAKSYTPKDTENYENLIKIEYKSQCGNIFFDRDEQLEVKIYCYHSIPKSVSNKKRSLMIAHRIRPAKKPDFDNMAKVVTDALNGIAYHDDNQIVDGMVRKFDDEQPRVEIQIKSINDEEKNERIIEHQQQRI